MQHELDIWAALEGAFNKISYRLDGYFIKTETSKKFITWQKLKFSLTVRV